MDICRHIVGYTVLGWKGDIDTYSVTKAISYMKLKTKIIKQNFKVVEPHSVWEMMQRRWVAGLAACKMFKFLQTFSLTSSNYMILALALERHRAVTRPLAVASSPYRKVGFSFP